MLRQICKHPVFPSLREKLTAVNVAGCPTCLLRFHVTEIAEIKVAMGRRGGVFSSRATAVDGLDKDSRKDKVAHKTLVRRWRLAKIDLHRDLTLLEDLRTDGADKPRWQVQLDKAFEFWSEKEFECSTIPGYTCKQDDDVLASEAGVDGTHDVDSTGFEQMEKTTSTLPVRLHSDRVAASRSQVSLLGLSRKRKRLSGPCSGPRSSRRARLDDQVTVICDTVARSTTALPASEISYKRPHLSYTTAEKARSIHEFDRVSRFYNPLTWALPHTYDNIDTSHYKMPWEIYDAVQRTEGAEELEPEEHKKLGDR